MCGAADCKTWRADAIGNVEGRVIAGCVQLRLDQGLEFFRKLRAPSGLGLSCRSGWLPRLPKILEASPGRVYLLLKIAFADFRQALPLIGFSRQPHWRERLSLFSAQTRPSSFRCLPYYDYIVTIPFRSLFVATHLGNCLRTSSGGQFVRLSRHECLRRWRREFPPLPHRRLDRDSLVRVSSLLPLLVVGWNWGGAVFIGSCVP
jgi:hypothetical protein